MLQPYFMLLIQQCDRCALPWRSNLCLEMRQIINVLSLGLAWFAVFEGLSPISALSPPVITNIKCCIYLCKSRKCSCSQIPLYTVLAVCEAPRLGRKRESHCLIYSLMWEQWSTFWQTQTRFGHVNDTWNVYPIFPWCVLWNNNAQQTCKIMQLMVICGKSTMVTAVAFSIRSHTLILNLMYATNMRSLKMMYDIW